MPRSKHHRRINIIDRPDDWPAHLALPQGAEHCAYMQRGSDEGRLIRLVSGALAMQIATGAIRTVDQRKAQAALDVRGEAET